MTNAKVGLVAASLLCSVVGLFPNGKQTPDMSTLPQYTDAGQLKLQEHYREWVYLATGFDMSFTPGVPVSHHMFDNIFVNPQATAYSSTLEHSRTKPPSCLRRAALVKKVQSISAATSSPPMSWA